MAIALSSQSLERLATSSLPSPAITAMRGAAAVSTYFASLLNAASSLGLIFTVGSAGAGTFTVQDRTIKIDPEWIPGSGHQSALSAERFAVLIAHELCHVANPFGRVPLLSNLTPAAAAQLGGRNEGICLVTEYVVATQLGVGSGFTSFMTAEGASFARAADSAMASYASAANLDVTKAVFSPSEFDAFTGIDSPFTKFAKEFTLANLSPSIAMGGPVPPINYFEYYQDIQIFRKCLNTFGNAPFSMSDVIWAQVPKGSLGYLESADGSCTFELHSIPLRNGTTASLEGSFDRYANPVSTAIAVHDARASTHQLSIASHEMTITQSNAQITIEPGSHVVIFGSGNRILTPGADSMVHVVGDNNLVLSQGVGGTISMIGDGGQVIAERSQIWINQGSDAVVRGDANRVYANGDGILVNIFGSNQSVITNNPGNVIGMSGDNLSVFGSNATLWFNNGADGLVSGDRNHVIANGGGVSVNIVGNGERVSSSAAGNSFGLKGEMLRVDATGAQLWFHPGAEATVNGNGNHLTADGSDIAVKIVGSDTTLYSTRAGNRFAFDGIRDTAIASFADIRYTADSSVAVNGSGNTLTRLFIADLASYDLDTPAGTGLAGYPGFWTVNPAPILSPVIPAPVFSPVNAPVYIPPPLPAYDPLSLQWITLDFDFD